MKPLVMYIVFGVIAELVNEESIRAKAIRLLDELMQHIVDNDWYLIDYDGKPTTWGKWNPEYVNGFPTMVGDRKLNSSNHCGDVADSLSLYRKGNSISRKRMTLMENHGYLENMMRPMEGYWQSERGKLMIGRPCFQSPGSILMMKCTFLGYWGLYRYAFTEELKEKYKASIIDHWEAERPEKGGLWNYFLRPWFHLRILDLKEAVPGTYRNTPWIMINWTVKNSHRKDIELLEENFRRQSTREVLPPDELQIRKHNANRVWTGWRTGWAPRKTVPENSLVVALLDGKYLNVISPPVNE